MVNPDKQATQRADKGDHVFFKHPKHGVVSGKVASTGRDGCYVWHKGESVPLLWSDIHGLKERKQRKIKVVEQGEDGFIAEDEEGKRVYVAGQQAEEEPLTKSLLIDVAPLDACCTNHALETMAKAMSESDIGIWAQHESPFIAGIVEKFTQHGLLRLASVREQLEGWIGGRRHIRIGERPRRPEGMMTKWTDKQLGLVKIYIDALNPADFDIEDWSLAIDYVVQKYLPEDELLRQGEWLATKASMMGKVEAHYVAMTAAAAELVVAALPDKLPGAFRQFKLTDAEQAIMQYGNLRCCDAVTAVADGVRHELRRVILGHQARALQGDTTATPGALQSELFDRFAQFNRDWRRIATTEAGEMCNQGVILSLPVGTMVRRMEMYFGACNFCKKIDGRVFRVVAASDPAKNGETDVWPGKTNIGRSASPKKRVDGELVDRLPSEKWWAAAGTMHPHCRGRWEPLAPLKPGHNPELAKWIAEKAGVVYGLPNE